MLGLSRLNNRHLGKFLESLKRPWPLLSSCRELFFRFIGTAIKMCDSFRSVHWLPPHNSSSLTRLTATGQLCYLTQNGSADWSWHKCAGWFLWEVCQGDDFFKVTLLSNLVNLLLNRWIHEHILCIFPSVINLHWPKASFLSPL